MQKTQTVCLILLTIMAVGFSLFFLQSVLLPFVIALLVVIGCRPLLDWGENRLQLPRFLSFILTFALGLGLMALFAMLTVLSIIDLAEHADSYQQRMNAIVQWVAVRLPEPDTDQPLRPIDSGSGDSTDQVTTDILLPGDLEDPKASARRRLEAFLSGVTNYIQSQLLRLAGSFSRLLSFGVLISIYVFFLLMGDAEHAGPKSTFLKQVEGQVRRYLVVKTVISALTGLAFGTVLWLFGVPLAILFGFLAFLLNFIPNIGPLISSLTPVPFLVLNSELSPAAAITCFLLCASVQFISGNVIETRIMGKSFDVSPVVLLLSLMFFGLVWGIIGMFLATPIVSILKIILEQHQSTRWFSDLMAGRWYVLDRFRAGSDA